MTLSMSSGLLLPSVMRRLASAASPVSSYPGWGSTGVVPKSPRVIECPLWRSVQQGSQLCQRADTLDALEWHGLDTVTLPQERQRLAKSVAQSSCTTPSGTPASSSRNSGSHGPSAKKTLPASTIDTNSMRSRFAPRASRGMMRGTSKPLQPWPNSWASEVPAPVSPQEFP